MPPGLKHLLQARHPLTLNLSQARAKCKGASVR